MNTMEGTDALSRCSFQARSDAADGELALVGGTVVPADIVARSTVLSCIAEAGGEASLPDAVTASEFISWLLATPLIDAGDRELKILTLCTVVKVADAIDDSGIGACIEQAAGAIERLASTHYSRASVSGCANSRHRTAAEAADSLATLPADLLHRVLAAALSKPSESIRGIASIHHLLRMLPESFHSSIISAAVSPLKHMDVHMTCSTAPFIKAFHLLTASPSAILSLTISEDAWKVSGWSWGELGENWRDCLKQLSALTSLSVMDASPELNQFVISALRFLNQLRTLRIPVFMDGSRPKLRPPRLIALKLQNALSAMPGLTDLTMAFMMPGIEKQNQKQKRENDHPSILQCPISNIFPAGLPVTSLALTVENSAQLRITSSIQLPSLVSLSLTAVSLIWQATFLNSLEASSLTLKSLSLNSGPDCHGQVHQDIVLRGMKRLAEAAVKFPVLQRLELGKLGACKRISAVFARILQNALTSGNPILSIEVLEVSTCFLTLQIITDHDINLYAALPRLKQLSVEVYHTAIDGEADPDSWTEVVQDLSNNTLKNCTISLSVYVDRDQSWTHRSGPQFSQLSTLTRLHKLSLHGYPFLEAPDEFTALSQMTQLQRLVLFASYMPAVAATELLPCLTALSSLTWLAISHRRKPEPFICHAFTQHLPHAWPKLLQLGLRLNASKLQKDEMTALVRVACSHASLCRLVIEPYFDDDAAYLSDDEEPVAAAEAAGSGADPTELISGAPAPEHAHAAILNAPKRRFTRWESLRRDLNRVAYSSKMTIVYDHATASPPTELEPE